MTFTLIIILFIVGFVPWSIGMLTFFYWFKKPPEGNDSSNRINNITSWWVGLTRPEVLGKYWKMFQMDIKQIMDAVQKMYDGTNGNGYQPSQLPNGISGAPMPPVKPPKKK